MAPTDRQPAGGLVAVLRDAAANRDLLRLQLGSVGWGTGEGAYVIGLTVVTYQLGGTIAVALLAVIRALPSVIAAPVLTGAIDRLALDIQLRAVMAIRVGLVLLATIVLATGASIGVLLAIAGVDAVLSTLLRPIRGAIAPAVARSPEELVASNVAITTGDSAAALVGPALAAVLLVVASPLATFVAGLALLAAAAIAIWGLRAAGPVRPAARERDATSRARRGFNGTARELVRGFGELARHRHARVIAAVFVCQRFVRGMFAVLAVAAAIDVLGLGEPGVGWLGSAIGLGGLFGGLLALRLVGGRRLVPAFAIGVAAWGLGFLVPGLAPLPAVALLSLAGAGIGKVVLDIAGFSLLQRTVPAESRGRILGALEGFVAAALALGSVAAAWLVESIGADGALVVAGALPIVAIALAWLPLRAADDAAVIPARELTSLRRVPFFRPLGLNALERLASTTEWVAVAAGQPIVREGEVADRFYIVESGRVEVTAAGAAVRRLGPGDSFGEIALLRSVPRTATVTTLEAATMAAIDGPAFLAAVTGHVESAAAASSHADERLATELRAAEECRLNERLLASDR